MDKNSLEKKRCERQTEREKTGERKRAEEKAVTFKRYLTNGL